MSKRILLPAVLEVLGQSAEERIAFVQRERWIGYTKADEILKKIERLFKSPRKTRMKSLIVIGPSNAGKTSIKKKFLNNHPEVEASDGERTIFSVLHIEANSKADQRAFCMRILDALGSDYPKSASFEILSKQVLDALKKTDVKMIVIDEFHNFLIGKRDMRDALRNTMRNISNERKISFLAFGTPEALEFITENSHMSSRFKREILPKWNSSDEDKLESLNRMLVSLESTLPLKKASNLEQKAIRDKLLQMSEGILGEIVDILEEATIMAIETGKEQITTALLDSLGWLSPSEREQLVA